MTNRKHINLSTYSFFFLRFFYVLLFKPNVDIFIVHNLLVTILHSTFVSNFNLITSRGSTYRITCKDLKNKQTNNEKLIIY